MAVLMPNEMDFRNKNFSMIISGSPGIGKTTLAMSAPDPVLVDFDGGVSRIKSRHRKATIIGDTYEEIRKDIETSPIVRGAKTIVIDTGGAFITYLQDWAMRDNPTLNKQKNGAISLKGFGAVKSEFVQFTNMLQYTMKKNIIYVFHTTEEKDGDIVKQRLLCEGAARNIVWQPCDLGCYIQLVGEKRYLGFTPTEQYFAKGCYGISGLIEVPELTESTANDLITRLFDEARENIAKESAEGAAEMDKYNAAMSQIRIVITNIVDAESATQSTRLLDGITHALTSKQEARAMLSSKMKELSLKWDKAGKVYVKE